MKKIYAIQCDPENFYWEDYLDEDTLVEQHISIMGNRDYNNLNESMVKEITTALDDAGYDLENMDFDEEDADPKDIINLYFAKKTEEDKQFTEEEYKKLVDLSMSWCASEETETLLEALKIIYGIGFTSGTIRGCCQGDWNNYIAPEGTDMKFYEAVYFNTGTEFKIAMEATEGEPDWDEIDCCFDYTHLYRNEDIKKWIADNNGCKPEEVLLILIDRTYYVTKHEYKTV